MIAQGAEAVLQRTKKGVLKDRVEKGYRHHQLDAKLRKERTRAEAKILKKARAVDVPVPNVLLTDQTTLLLEDLQGELVKDVLDKKPELAEQIGTHVATLHDAHLIHGDLTTSNMLVHDGKISLIDFGLAFHSQRLEDKAVDLHVFRQVLEGRHHKVQEMAWNTFLKGYKPKDVKDILERLTKVEKRGKNK